LITCAAVTMCSSSSRQALPRPLRVPVVRASIRMVAGSTDATTSATRSSSLSRVSSSAAAPAMASSATPSAA
jgi:hypothetical protein